MDFDCVYFIQSLVQIDGQRNKAKKAKRNKMMCSGGGKCAN